MDARPKGLVVTSDLDRADAWMARLRKAGYMPIGCVGPGLNVDCPRVRGARCALRDAVSVAIVDLACGAHADLCTRVPDDGTTMLVHGDDLDAAPRDLTSARLQDLWADRIEAYHPVG